MSDYDIYQTDTDLEDEELGEEDGGADDGTSEGDGTADHVEDDELLEGDEAEEE